MYSGVLALLPVVWLHKIGPVFGSDFWHSVFVALSCQRAQTLICTTPRPRATRKRVDRAHTQITMVLKSLLFAMLLSDAAGGCGLGTPPHACKPRLRGTSSDVNPPLPRDDDTIERAAVSNQFNPGPRPGASRTGHCRFPAASRAMNHNPNPDSNDARVPFTTGPYRQNAPSRTRNLAHSAASVPPWLPNATSGVIDLPCAGGRRRVTRPTARSRRLG